MGPASTKLQELHADYEAFDVVLEAIAVEEIRNCCRQGLLLKGVDRLPRLRAQSLRRGSPFTATAAASSRGATPPSLTGPTGRTQVVRSQSRQ